MENKRLWGGRFDRKPAQAAEAFSNSLDVDRRLAEYDVVGSIAHAKMLEHAGLLNGTESKKIVVGLSEIKTELEKGTFVFEPSDEDIHTAVERRLYEKIGDSAGKLHTGRSRNDQIVLDERLYVRDLINRLDIKIKTLQKALLVWAKEYPDLVMPAFTHLQHSQPILFSHWVLAYLEMFQRDQDRLSDALVRVNVAPLGAGAGAGSSLPLKPEYTAKLLGFPKIFTNSLDAVSDRDFLVEVLADLALVSVHLSRICEEMVLWSSAEFNYLDISAEYCTGSSALPQKKNPDIPELIRGKTGLVFGGLISLLTTLKGLPLSYNRDLQEDKAPFFSAADTVLDSLEILASVILKTKVNIGAVEKSAETGYLDAFDLAEFLVKKNVPFREAHRIVGAVVKYAAAQKKKLSELSLAQLKEFSKLFDRKVADVLSAKNSVRNRKTAGSTNPALVALQLQKWAKLLKE
ncbi:MAG: argininosuccinate lyase [Candidatus Omnitrophica bacterium]|nr:argininosuccinate lyase [Candidatus Omnitrophota bacterium]